jgi:hypothetical protein
MKLPALLKYHILVFSLIVLFTACSSSTQPNATLEEIALEFNKNCPQMIDSETRIDGIHIKEPNTVIYRYTLINLPVQNVDTIEFKKALTPGIISIIKLSPEMKQLRENNTNFEYHYFDKTNKHIYTFKIFPNDYNS